MVRFTYESDTADQIVDTCLEQLGAGSSEIELIRCVTSYYGSGLGEEFWKFSRNILLGTYGRPASRVTPSCCCYCSLVVFISC